MLKKLLIWILLWTAAWSYANELYWLSEPSLDVGLLADHEADEVRISNTSRYISFVSKANNLVNNDFNHIEDLFIRDLQTGITELVSVTQSGQQAMAEGIVSFSRPSANGRYVAFVSQANEYPGGNGEDDQLFVKDLVTGELINESTFGSNGVVDIDRANLYLADDGLSVIFSTRTQIDPLHLGNNSTQVYIKDRTDDSYTLLSTSQAGTAAADGDTESEHVSSSGRYVLLLSRADNLSADVNNNNGDNLYVLDRLDDSRTLINITTGGISSTESNSSGWIGQVSNQGTVVFTSKQTDMVVGDTNNRGDVFFSDGGVITRINVDALGNQMINTTGNNDVAISADGSRVAFIEYSDELFPADSNSHNDLYAYDTNTGVVSLVSQNALGSKANNHSYDPQLSEFGELLLFTTLATDLPNVPTFGSHASIIQHQFNTGSMIQEHVAAFSPETIMDDVNHVKISSDHMSVVFSSQSPNLVPEPLNDTLDLYLLNRDTGIMDRIAANINGYEHDLSPSGRFISFRTINEPPLGTNSLGTYRLYRFDRQTNQFLSIAEGFNSRVNDQGVVVFDTFEDLVPNDTNGQRDVYAYNPNNGLIVLVSEDMSGQAAGTDDFDMGGSNGEVWVTFTSDNDNIVSNDTNGESDVFLKQLGGGSTLRISMTSQGTQANDESHSPAISPSGRWVAFFTLADNLTSDDYTDAYFQQALLFDRQTGDHALVSLNQQGMPLTNAGTSGISRLAVTNGGRFVSFTFKDENDVDDNRSGASSEFSADTDGKLDLVLHDVANGSSRIISQFTDGTESVDAVEQQIQIRLDLSSSPPNLGVVFMADHGTLTGRLGHPGHTEAYLYQQPVFDPDVIFQDDFE